MSHYQLDEQNLGGQSFFLFFNYLLVDTQGFVFINLIFHLAKIFSFLHIPFW